MSALSKFMHTAHAILDEHQRKASPNADQPPFWTRTTWLFAELEELALPNETNIFAALKVARIRNITASVGPLLKLIETNTGVMPPGRERHQRGQLCTWIREQVAKEIPDAH